MPRISNPPQIVELVDELEFKRRFKAGWLLPPQAAKRWGVAESTVYKYLKQGRLAFVKNASNYHVLIDPSQAKP